VKTEKVRVIHIDGHIFNAEEEEFNREFLTWLDSKGWMFIGITEVDKEEE